MKTQGTKQLMQELQSALKDLKAVYQDRNNIIQQLNQNAESKENKNLTHTTTEIK